MGRSPESPPRRQAQKAGPGPAPPPPRATAPPDHPRYYAPSPRAGSAAPLPLLPRKALVRSPGPGAVEKASNDWAAAAPTREPCLPTCSSESWTPGREKGSVRPFCLPHLLGALILTVGAPVPAWHRIASRVRPGPGSSPCKRCGFSETWGPDRRGPGLRVREESAIPAAPRLAWGALWNPAQAGDPHPIPNLRPARPAGGRGSGQGRGKLGLPAGQPAGHGPSSASPLRPTHGARLEVRAAVARRRGGRSKALVAVAA